MAGKAGKSWHDWRRHGSRLGGWGGCQYGSCHARPQIRSVVVRQKPVTQHPSHLQLPRMSDLAVDLAQEQTARGRGINISLALDARHCPSCPVDGRRRAWAKDSRAGRPDASPVTGCSSLRRTGRRSWLDRDLNWHLTPASASLDRLVQKWCLAPYLVLRRLLTPPRRISPFLSTAEHSRPGQKGRLYSGSVPLRGAMLLLPLDRNRARETGPKEPDIKTGPVRFFDLATIGALDHGSKPLSPCPKQPLAVSRQDKHAGPRRPCGRYCPARNRSGVRELLLLAGTASRGPEGAVVTIVLT